MTDHNRETVEELAAIAAATKPRRRLRTWLVRLTVGTVLVVASLALSGKIYLDRVQSGAMQLAQTGTSLNSFLKSYIDLLQARDIPGLLSLYDRNYADDRNGLWDERLQSDRDEIQVYSLNAKVEAPFTPADVGRQVQWHLDRMGAIESGKFPISTIESIGSDGRAVIRAVMWLRASTPDGRARESWTTLRLRLRPEGPTWKITRQELLDCQAVVGGRRGFTDITGESGIAFESGHNPMLNEPEWFPKKFGIMKYATAGVTAADYDNDGWCDIFFGDGANPRLYRNKHDGTFEDVTAAAGLPGDLEAVHVALLVDLDNDGDRELFLGRSTGQNYLYRNNGDGKFTDVSATANLGGLWVATASAADYDNDGKVDLYLGRYLDPRKNLPSTNFFTRNGEGNSLLHNEGGLRFRDVTQTSGVREGGLTLGLCWGDYDKDGFSDVFVANDFGRSVLYHNNHYGTFTDVPSQKGALYLGYGMSASFADIDNDGDLDIYVAGVHSGQRWFGNAVTLQRYVLTSLQEGTFVDDFPLYRELIGLIGNDWKKLGERVIRGNALMLNNGDGTFSDVTETSGTNPQGWYWGCQVADLDHDGLQDIYASNGWITGKSHEDL
jgi:FG-GAP-like repeat